MRLIKPGDWLVMVLGLALAGFLFSQIRHGGEAQQALIRKGGEVFAEVSLFQERRISVPGPLGVSMIAISGGAARIVQDPGPRQYCVRQGWLRHEGDVAVCLPNQVSVELVGRKKRYDSLNY